MKPTLQQFLKITSWQLVASVASVIVCMSARATDPIFINNSAAFYSVGGSAPIPPPVYDVTAFDNENIFQIDYVSPNVLFPFYETMNTVFYTNNGTMTVNSPMTTNGFVVGTSLSNGFRFDLQTTNNSSPHNMAGTFYNTGAIRSNSTQDGNDYFDFGFGPVFTLISLGFVDVTATNIINSGTINAGPDGRIQLIGQNVDLSFGSLTNDPVPSQATLLALLGINNSQAPSNLRAAGAVGSGFNWTPSISLNANSATSSVPNQVTISNSLCYMWTNNVGISNRIVHAFFIANKSPNVPYNVYRGQPADTTLGIGAGTIEWTGIYEDPATCAFYTNYLYLNDLFQSVLFTNLGIINGLPSNFTFTEDSIPRMTGGTLVSSGFSPTFGPTNATSVAYSYVNAQLGSGSVVTNASQQNPSGALTNLPGKILITATNRLTMANAQISGENYLSIYAPRQFDGSQDARIIAPYSDINLGVTNGRLDLANLISSGVPTIGGTIVVWSGDWLDFDQISGVFTEYRVAIVQSQLTPTSKSWIQNLTLHATNSLVINDVMNVYRSLLIDAKNLTLATNICGNNFTSFSGELNWANLATLNTTQLPNLLWLTNSGAISAWNDAVFGSSSLRYGAFINYGLVSDNGTAIWTTNFVNGGTITNGSGAFTLQTYRAVMTNGAVYANGSISLSATNLFVTNEVIVAGKSLTLTTISNLSDGTVPCNTSSNFWTVGALVTGSSDGIFFPFRPTSGDLLGTTITNIAPANKPLQFQWPGEDRGYSLAGYSNNAALGHLVLDALGASPLNGRFNFSGIGASNALYVDCIEFKDFSTNSDASGNVQGINFATNFVIYYAQAIRNGQSIAEKLNLKNTNNGVSANADPTNHFRWMPAYAGYFSATNMVYPDGTTNCVNAALAQSQSYDSDKDGTLNYLDPSPIFVPSQINFGLSITNPPAGKRARLSWWTIPQATNTVLCKTNILQPNWTVLTNFVVIYPPPGTGAATNVVVLDPGITNSPTARFYRIAVTPAFP